MNDDFASDGNQRNPNDSHEDAEQEPIDDSLQREFGDAYPDEEQNDSDRGKKPSILIRIYHSLWRRRLIKLGRINELRPKWTDTATVFLTLGILVAAGTQAYIYWKQSHIMQFSLEESQRMETLAIGQTRIAQNVLGAAKKSADVSAESLYDVQRAFLTFPASPIVDVFANIPNVPDPLFQLTMTIENTGVTPARQIVDRVSCITQMGPLPTNYLFPDQRDSCGTPWAATGASFIPAKSSVQSQGVYVDFKFIKEFQEQSHGPWVGHIGRPDHPTRTINFYGWVTYRDIFDNTPEHLSEFCRTLTILSLNVQQGKAAGAWGFCPMHNCTDKDCADYDQRIAAAHAALKCCPSQWFKKEHNQTTN